MDICFTGTAPRAWNNPAVSKDISSKVFYNPISDVSVTSIVINESGESLVDLLESKNSRLLPLAFFDSKYKNTYKGWSKVRLGVYNRLIEALKLLPENIGIAYFEGFRTLKQQKLYFDNKFIEILQTIPDGNSAYMETAKHVSPFIDNIPTHATGAAIDMTLFEVVDGQRKILDMGKFDVIFGPNSQQETFSTNTSTVQRLNRLLLLKAATEAGFANYGFEWWHYSYGDKMHAVTYKKPYAIYGLAMDKDNENLTIEKNEYIKQMTEENTKNLF